MRRSSTTVDGAQRGKTIAPERCDEVRIKGCVALQPSARVSPVDDFGQIFRERPRPELVKARGEEPDARLFGRRECGMGNQRPARFAKFPGL
jgi:hypothetical protein